MVGTSFDEILEAVERLPSDEQADLVRIIRRRLVEGDRRRIYADVQAGQAEFDDGFAKPSTVEDLMREIGS